MATDGAVVSGCSLSAACNENVALVWPAGTTTLACTDTSPGAELVRETVSGAVSVPARTTEPVAVSPSVTATGSVRVSVRGSLSATVMVAVAAGMPGDSAVMVAVTLPSILESSTAPMLKENSFSPGLMVTVAGRMTSSAGLALSVKAMGVVAVCERTTVATPAGLPSVTRSGNWSVAEAVSLSMSVSVLAADVTPGPSALRVTVRVGFRSVSSMTSKANTTPVAPAGTTTFSGRASWPSGMAEKVSVSGSRGGMETSTSPSFPVDPSTALAGSSRAVCWSRSAVMRMLSMAMPSEGASELS